MSRVGNKSVALDKITAVIADQTITLNGTNGLSLKIDISPKVTVEIIDGQVHVKDVSGPSPLRGTTRQNIQNAVTGLTKGFREVLQLKGVGYKVIVDGKHLTFHLGYSHPIVYILPDAINIDAAPAEKAGAAKTTKGDNGKQLDRLDLISHDKQLLGQVVNDIIRFRPPEPYKGKGVIREGSYIRRKEIKKS